MSFQSPITGLNGIVLIASDYAKQVSFYRDVLGLPVTSSDSDATFFKCGDQVLAIFAKGHHPEGDATLRGASHGISHLEFRIDSNHLNAMSEKLKLTNAHSYRDVFQDADGNLFHFVLK